MTADIVVVLNRISADFKLLADLALKALKPLENEERQATPSPAPDTKVFAVPVPVLKERYTRAEAEVEKARIEEAHVADLITWDKKRGMKMLVTKRTDGWSPVK
jgi:hypothetical protein